MEISWNYVFEFCGNLVILSGLFLAACDHLRYCVFVTFNCSVSGQVWSWYWWGYLIVSIPDLCLLLYLITRGPNGPKALT